jgi:drug/metabolite transporter, DME family
MKDHGRLLIASAGIVYGTIAVGGSLLTKAGLSALDISFFYLLISVLRLLPFAITSHLFARMVKSWKYLSLYSLANTGLVVLQFESLKLGLAPGISALLLYTQPVWTIIFGRVFFSESVSRSRIGIIALALAGVVLIADPTSFFRDMGSGTNNIPGELAALIGAVFLSFWIILGKKGRLDVFQRPEELVFAVRASTFFLIALVCLATLVSGGKVFFDDPPAISRTLVPLIIFAIGAGTVPDFLFYSGIQNVEALQAGVILLLEPISAVILSVALMISTPSLIQVAGGALILLSNYFVNKPGLGQR